MSRGHRFGHIEPIEETLAFLAPVISNKTVATVTSVNSPYAVKPTDSLVKFDESNGLLATAVLPAAPVIGERHTFKWWNWDLASPPPVVGGGGKQVESWPNNEGAQSLGPTTNITTQGAQGTWEYDGTQWVLVSV
jgi:hypothetical protein